MFRDKSFHVGAVAAFQRSPLAHIKTNVEITPENDYMD